jgi:hypothetical protein
MTGAGRITLRIHQSDPGPRPMPGLSPIIDVSEAPGAIFKDSDVELRSSNFVAGWDLSLNYLYHYVDEPVVRA